MNQIQAKGNIAEPNEGPSLHYSKGSTASDQKSNQDGSGQALDEARYGGMKMVSEIPISEQPKR